MKKLILIIGVILIILIAAGGYFKLQKKSMLKTTINKKKILTANLENNSSKDQKIPLLLPQATLLFRIEGSRMIGQQLLPTLIESFFRQLGFQNIQTKPAGLRSLTIQGKTASQEVCYVQIDFNKISDAFTSLSNNMCHMVVTARQIEHNEKLLFKKYGAMTSPATEHIIGFNGLAIIVNKKNPIDKLSMTQLQDIFSGRLTNWQQVGGSNTQIKVFISSYDSELNHLFESFVFQEKLTFGSFSKPIDSPDFLVNEVARDLNAISFTERQYSGSVKVCSINAGNSIAQKPTSFSIKTEDYHLSFRIHLYTLPNSDNEYVIDLLSFINSSAGQNLISRSGFQNREIITANPEEIVHYCQGCSQNLDDAIRLSSTFRFSKTKEGLFPDARGIDDFQQIIAFLEKEYVNHNREFNVLLIGHSYESDSAEYNETIVKQLLNSVSQNFKRRGILPTMLHCGHNIILSEGYDERARDKNRRVEIWVK